MTLRSFRSSMLLLDQPKASLFPATVTIPAGVNAQVDIAFADDGLDEGFESELHFGHF